MSLLQKAVETYDAHRSLVGVIQEEREVPLAPVAHQTTTAQICVTLDRRGNYCSAEKMDEKIIIPVTEQSAGRSGKTIRPHPLCDQISYLYPTKTDNKYEAYLEQLRAWQSSAYSHPKLLPILKYVEKGTLLQDLSEAGVIRLNPNHTPEKEKDLICWRVLNDEKGVPAECWRDKTLFDAFGRYVLHKKETANAALCLVNGNWAAPTAQHPKGISAINANAKLISSNDTSGFTFRGRFIDDAQAASVSFEASQKAHNALRWLLAGQSVSIDGRSFLCWNPKGLHTPGVVGNFRRHKQSEVFLTPSDYREALLQSLLLCKAELPDTADVIIAVFDAATNGRLSVTYYNELRGSDFLQRLHDWEGTCCWYNGPFGIQTPDLYQIVHSAFGTRRSEGEHERWEADDKVLKQQIQRLVSCRVDRRKMPADIVKAIVNRVSNPNGCSLSLWRKTVFIACAVLNKYITERNGTDIMSWDLNTCDRSFQFGRLLAAMERAELDYYKRTNETRQTNAIKGLADFRRHPFSAYERIDSHLRIAYLPRMDAWAAQRYLRIKGEIAELISTFPKEELNKPLEDVYLLGYDLQRMAFYKSETKENKPDEIESEEA